MFQHDMHRSGLVGYKGVAGTEECPGPGWSIVPQSSALAGCWPNPFNPQTTVTFTLSAPGPAQLTVYDLRGRAVANLVDRDLGAGEHTVTWDGRDAQGVAVSSGVYVMQLETRDGICSRKIVLAR